jgi:hypothetical protein
MPSSVVAHIHYNRDRQILRITFVSGMVYEYLEVPEEAYQNLISSDSKGSYLNRFIKNRYDYKKIA